MTSPVAGASVNVTFSGASSAPAPALSTATGNLIVVCIHAEHPTNDQNVTSVTDTIGNTYTRRHQMQWITSAAHQTAEIWYAISTGTNASNVITASMSTGNVDDAGFVAMIVTGHNASHPWDGNGSLTAGNNTGLSPLPNANVTGISTLSPDDLFLSFVCADHNVAFTSPVVDGVAATIQNSWSNNGGSNWSYGVVSTLSVSAIKSNITAAYTNANDRWGMLVDAITADGPVIKTLCHATVIT